MTATVVATPSVGGERRAAPECSTAANVTRSLLGYLAVAGPFYVALSLAQAFTREGFDPARHEWSLLALGHFGWIQCVNLVITGAMVILGAVGVRRAMSRSAGGGVWVPRLFAGYGVSLVGAGIFRADPALGFPPGTPAGAPMSISAHGMLHLVFGAVGFACLIAACFVVARAYARRGGRRDATIARAVGIVFVAAFAGIATGTTPAANVAFTAAVIVSCAWLTAVAIDLYRGTRTAQP